MPQIGAGVDIGKEHHHCVVINTDGERLLSRRVLNDERALLELMLALARRRLNVLWAMIRDGACYQATPSVTAAA